jgi:acyl-coenzyme A synthetase/AMP-(fatty) acid ligase
MKMIIEVVIEVIECYRIGEVKKIVFEGFYDE